MSGGSPVAVLSANRAYGIASSRKWLVDFLVERGWRVIVAAAEDSSAEGLQNRGAEFTHIPWQRGGIDIASDLAALRGLTSLYRDCNPDLVLLYNTKPILLGGLAARAAPRARVVNTVTGLGYGLTGGRWMSTVLRRWYRFVLPRAAATIFQNPDDKTYFIEQGLVEPGNAHVVPSSGVDCERFHPSTERSVGPVTVLLVGRLVWQKGIREYADAARLLRPPHPAVRFLLAGEADPMHPDAVPDAWLRDRVSEGTLEFVGYLEDMPSMLRSVDLVVVPSTFREGFPRVLLEAGASGVPSITTDVAGCREAVRHGETGLVVPPGDSALLREGIDSLVSDATLRRTMGRKARQYVEANFDESIVINRTREILDRVAGEGAFEDGPIRGIE